LKIIKKATYGSESTEAELVNGMSETVESKTELDPES
jgi:hypothetical protein